MLTLGWKASAEQFGPRELLDYGVAAERHGFDSIVVSDHFHPWKDTDGHAPFSFAWLGAVGALTKRAKLGTSVVTPTFRYHPATASSARAARASSSTATSSSPISRRARRRQGGTSRRSRR